MTLSDRLGISDRQERLLVRGMQTVLAGLVLYGVVTLQLGMVSNGVLALAITFLPALLRREYDYSMDAGLVLWITVAVFLHSIGSLGPYGAFPWYDAVTHTISSTVIAGIGYASLRAVEHHTGEVETPTAFRAVFIVVFVLAAGVIWEIVEFASGGLASVTGARAPLTVMGIDDIVSDMIFNTVGAVLVAGGGTGYFDGPASFLRRRLDSDNST